MNSTINMEHQLPDGWVETKLGEIGNIVSGGTPSTNIKEYWGDEINWISPVDLSGYTKKYISKGGKSITKLGLKNSSAKLMPPGSVLFSSRAPIGYVAIASSELCTNQGFKSVVPFSCVFNEYLYYYLKSAKKLAEDFASGTTFKEISLSNFAKLPIPLPPLPEQHRIVAKIEELFSRLDKGIESLKTAQQQLKVYRQAVLKWAFEGRLTNKEVKDGELPEGWKKVALKELTTKIVDGTHHTPEYKSNGVPFISVKDIYDYKIDFNNTKFISEETHKELIKRCKPEEGDILITKSGTIGRLSIVPNKEFSLFVSVALLKIRRELITSKFALFSLQNHINHLDIDSQIKGGLLKNYHLEDLRKAEIIYAPLPEQHHIVSEIERRLSVADKLEEAIATALQEAEALRQSILKKAFEGRLLSEAERNECRQDPTWEPASVLLERIKAEKSGLGKKGFRDGKISKKKKGKE